MSALFLFIKLYNMIEKYKLITPKDMKVINDIFNLSIETLDRFNVNEHKTQGVYFLYDSDKLVYIGKSNNIINRIHSHKIENYKTFDSWSYIEIVGDIELHERLLINKYLPKYNKDGITKKLRHEQT